MNDETIKTKPCEACGADAEIRYQAYLDVYPNFWLVCCENKRCPGLKHARGTTKQEAVDGWNEDN